jgi:hypothetical protein
MKAVAEADEKKRKRMIPRSTGSGSSSGAPPKYRMVYTPPGVSCVDHSSSRIWAIIDNSSNNNHSSNSSSTPLLHRHSRLPLGRHSSSPLATFYASTAGRWATLLENVTSPSKATRHELRHPWSINRWAIKRVMHQGRAVPTTPPWRRFPREKKC